MLVAKNITRVIFYFYLRKVEGVGFKGYENMRHASVQLSWFKLFFYIQLLIMSYHNVIQSNDMILCITVFYVVMI